MAYIQSRFRVGRHKVEVVFMQCIDWDVKGAMLLEIPELSFLTTYVTEHYSLVDYDPDHNPIPVLSDKENWLYLYHDTVYPATAPSLTLPQLEVLLKRNNFTIYTNSHFYPLPTTTSFYTELVKALISLAERLLDNYSDFKIEESIWCSIIQMT